MTKAIARRPAEPAVPNIPGLADTIRQLNSERAAWAANGDQWSQGRAVHFAEQIEALHALDPALVERVSLARDARGAMTAEITPRAPAIRRATSAPRKIKTIKTRRVADGTLIADVYEADAEPEPRRRARQVVVKGEQSAPSPAPDSAGDGAKTSWMSEYDEILGGEGKATEIFDAAVKRANAIYRQMKEQAPDAALRSLVIALYGETQIYLHVHRAKREAVQHRIADLEARRELRYLGVWKKDEKYVENSAVTHDGQIWIAKADTVERPGGNVVWQLAVRKGQDAK